MNKRLLALFVAVLQIVSAQQPVLIRQNGNTATVSAASALKVDGSAVTQPVSGTVTTTPPANASTNVTQLAGTGVDTNSGNKSAGTLRVTLATDQVQLTNSLKVDGSAVTQPVSAASLPLPTGAATSAKQPALGTAGTASTDVITVQGITSMTPLLVTNTTNASTNLVQLNGTTVDTNSGNKSAGTLRVTLATDQIQLTNALKVDGSAVTQPISGSVTATQATGTNLHVVTDATSVTAATLGAETTKVIGTVRTVGNVGGVMDAITGGTSPANALQVGAQFNTSPGTLTNGQMGALQTTAAQNLKTDSTTIAGTTIDTNSGNKSAGTQRMVLATDQPNLTTALNVALAANQSVNVAQINGVTPLMGNGATGTGAVRVSIANDSTGVVQPGNTANTTPWLAAPAAEATTANSSLTSYLTSAASTNSTSVKGSAGNVYGYSIINTTATLYYLRMYNSSSAPTCSSATGFVETIPIPASSTGAGVERWPHVPQGFTTGIGFCLTGGGSSTDNTNAATGVYLTILYK